ncbi:hypothetical protein DIPPA_26445 [Diplonema papillatum]|nr:hypothetical protein DIPPA_26445 [Diplonema papillatum]
MMRAASQAGLLVLSVAVAWLVSDPHLAMETVVGCFNDDADGECAFSDDYKTARHKFRQAVSQIPGMVHESHAVIEGSDYTIDFAYLKSASAAPEDGGDLVVHFSGTHGVEGFAGSAVQTATLREWARDPAKLPRKGTSVLFVHALNPFGMAHNRRFNEHNVDLNRNAVYDPEARKALVEREDVAGYFQFDQLLNPSRPPTVIDSALFFYKIVKNILAHGLPALKRALVTGQYTKPSSIFYGGATLQPSYVILQQFFEAHRLTKATGKAVHIDVHTGLGPSGVDTMLVASDRELRYVERVFPWDAAEYPQTKVESTDGGVKSQQAGIGYDLAKGMSGEAIEYLLPEAQVAATICQEFGTLHMVLVGRALMLENMAFQHDKRHQPYWATYTRDAFYVRTSHWRNSVLERGIELLSQAVSAEL